MIDHDHIYSSEAASYDLLVSREDVEGNLLPALNEVASLEDGLVVELGTGTGRLARLAAPLAARVVALDGSAHMLAVAQKRLPAVGMKNWSLAVADNRRLPLPNRLADAALAGWTISHLTSSRPLDWPAHIDRAVGEMIRVLRPGGAAVIVETLGTGQERPRPPGETLAAYYRRLETRHGFARRWIRTDYRFASLEEAERLTAFFFGPTLADRVRREGLIELPECTGIWWKRA